MLGVVIVLLGVATSKELYRKYQMRQGIEKLKGDIAALEGSNKDLASLVDSFQDPQVVEREAKKRLNLKKPGENVVIILRDKNDESQNIVQAGDFSVESSGYTNTAEQSDGESKDIPNAFKWWMYITSN